MNAVMVGMLAALLLATASTAAGQPIRVVPVRVETGGSATTVTGRISGDEIVDYRVRAGAGQTMSASLQASNRSAYFNVVPRGSDAALFIGSIDGNRFEARLDDGGEYTIRVYLMRNAARRDEVADYTLEMSVGGAGETPDAAARAGPRAGDSFESSVELHGIRFRVASTTAGSINTLRIETAGLAIDNPQIVRTVEGTVTGAEVADLDADGSPEIYVYITSAGSGSYGSLVAYSANRRKSLSEIHLPPVSGNDAAWQGYMGHDEFAVVENTFVRRFPVYAEGDTNARPTGGTRQLQYKLVRGEAGWLLQLDRVVEY